MPLPAGSADRHRRYGPGRLRPPDRTDRRTRRTYEDVGERKRYIPSGNEPEIYLYSRSGVPYCAKSAHGVDPYGDYRPSSARPRSSRI